MRAIVISELGGPEQMVLGERPEPVPGPGQLVAKVAAAGVNFIDIYRRSGVYHQPVPYVPGSEGAGTVVAVGEGVTDFAPGDRVAWAEGSGSYAEQVIVDARQAVPVPDGIDLKTAAAAMLQGMTAHYLCHSTYLVTEGTVAVVHAAAGGVGLLLTQMIKQLGGTVIATTSSPAKSELARQAGADRVTTYEDVALVMLNATGGKGVDVVYDSVGQATFDTSLTLLHPRGMLVLFGASSGPVPPVDPQALNRHGSLYLTRPTLGNYLADRAELLWRAEDVLGWVAQGRLQVRVGAEYPLADAAQAQEDLAARRTTGKVILVP